MEKDVPWASDTARLEWPHSLNNASKHQFEQIIHLIRTYYGVGAAFFSLADKNRQHIRASQGLGSDQLHQVLTLCDSLIQQDTPLIVPDVSQDARFSDDFRATGEQAIRFYAGVPDKSCIEECLLAFWVTTAERPR
ncbi:GAF domain-containing protein [Pseudomonas sp. NP21570]|uniref:GAF domain-containing protein n=1 Tax=Stutzerimonas kunmingensis TaxID=1211807 RepID=UPI001E2CF713|nr:GAF domain-containing protein [Stutzerimonas kunmingensis]MCB4797131.1 GAF domain-containing protein [Pseudomonas sp. NP21570]